ncbi:MAG: ABC transporter substrate-binding protein [Desulfobacterales bacterium]|nr:ABC transporter substrate-binding protein [Desulfobacterales bacterium]
MSSEHVPGVTDNEIIIGSSLALNGHAGYLGTQTLHGALSYINYVNDQGGIYGRKIKLITYDDGYDPPRCVANTQKLIVEDKVFALFCYVGTPTTVKIIPLVEQAKIPLIGMFTGANALREPFNRYLINVRASYYQETGAAVKHFVEDLGIKKIAVFYQYDAYGFDGLRGTEIALKNYGLAPVERGSYIRGTQNIEDGLDKIHSSGAKTVVMIGTYDPCAKFIKSAKAKGFNPIFYNVSFVGADELARKLGKEGEGVIVTQVVPSPEAPESQNLLWGAREYSDLLRHYYPGDAPNFVGLEGYLNARVLVEGLKRAGRNLNRERFIDAIESIENYSLGIANTLNFSPTNHQGLSRVYFTRIQNGKFELWTDWQKLKKERSVPGVTPNQVLFGSSLALGGHAGYLGTQTLHGALAYLNFVNEHGGIHGRKIKVIAYDDGYDPPRCISNTQRLIEKDRVFGLFCYVGTPTSVEIIPLVEREKVPLLGLFTGAHILREPTKRYIMNVRASYYEETAAAIKHFIEDLHLKKVAVFYQDDAYGLDGLKGAELALKKYDLTPVAKGSYIRGTMDVEKGLDHIIASGAEAVVMVGTYDPCAKFIKLAKSRGFNPIFHNVSFVGGDELARKLGADGEGVIVTQVVPPPEARVLLPAAKDYARLLKKYYPEDTPNFVGFEGFINAKILVEGLRRAGRDVTREGFIEAIESLERYFVGIGAKVSFSSKDHQGLEQVYFTQIRNGQLVLVTSSENGLELIKGRMHVNENIK